MTAPDRPPGGLPAWPTVPSPDEAPPTAPPDPDLPEAPTASPDPDLPEAPTASPHHDAAASPDAAAATAGPGGAEATDVRAPAAPAPTPQAPAAPPVAAPAPVPQAPAAPTQTATAPPTPATGPPARTPRSVDLTKDGPAPAEADPPPAAADASAARRAWLVAGALALVVVLLAVASAVLLRKDRDQDERADRLIALAAVQDPDGPALRAAATAVERLLSYDHRTLDADFAEGQRLLTPSFGAKYGDFTAKLVRPPALQARARVVATLQVLAATEASRPDRAEVLAFVDQTTTSALLKQPAVDQSRLTLTLVPVEGRWLVCNLVVTGSAPAEVDPCST